jgi:hypothetical protein
MIHSRLRSMRSLILKISSNVMLGLLLFLRSIIIRRSLTFPRIIIQRKMVVSVFFAPARYRVVKIVCSCFEVVLRTMKNYKAHYSLSWFRPLLRGNSTTSSVFVIEEDE